MSVVFQSQSFWNKDISQLCFSSIANGIRTLSVVFQPDNFWDKDICQLCLSPIANGIRTVVFQFYS